MTLSLDSSIIEHTTCAGALDAHNLNWFHSLIDYNNLDRIRYLDFTIHHRKNLANENSSSSTYSWKMYAARLKSYD